MTYFDQFIVQMLLTNQCYDCFGYNTNFHLCLKEKEENEEKEIRKEREAVVSKSNLKNLKVI